MRVPKDQQKELFTPINELKDFLPEDETMMIFSHAIYPVFQNEDFKYCYSAKGINAISLVYLSCDTLLQFGENLLNDTKTAEAVMRRLDWKIVLHLCLKENVSFDPSTLFYYGGGLKENDKMSMIFDKIVGLAQ